jgi:F0F1-type ATP synthase assembly protein I
MAKRTDSDVTNATGGDQSSKKGIFKRRNKEGKADKKPGRMKQMRDVFQMTRRNDPSVVWLMLLAFLGITAVGLLIGLLIGNWITALIIALPLGLLAAMFILSRRAERAAFSQLDGQPGAAGAALSTLRRGWITEEQPAAVDPRSQDAVFRAIGRPGVVLVSEGPPHRVKRLIEGERKRLRRILPNVSIHVVQTGDAEDQVPLSKVSKRIQKLDKELTKQEVQQVNKRISSLGNRLPIPKGVDPFKARPDRKAARGR